MSDPQAPLPPTPIVMAAPVPGPNPVEGINIYSDKYEYKTIEAGTTFTYGPVGGLDKIVNTHLQQGWKLFGDMKVIDSGRISSGSHVFIYYQVMIRKLPAQGGGRSSVRTRKAKLKSHPPHKRHK